MLCNRHVQAWLAFNASNLSNTARERADWMERYWREVDATKRS